MKKPRARYARRDRSVEGGVNRCNTNISHLQNYIHVPAARAIGTLSTSATLQRILDNSVNVFKSLHTNSESLPKNPYFDYDDNMTPGSHYDPLPKLNDLDERDRDWLWQAETMTESSDSTVTQARYNNRPAKILRSELLFEPRKTMGDEEEEKGSPPPSTSMPPSPVPHHGGHLAGQHGQHNPLPSYPGYYPPTPFSAQYGPSPWPLMHPLSLGYNGDVTMSNVGNDNRVTIKVVNHITISKS